jgi:hypothetical protein
VLPLLPDFHSTCPCSCSLVSLRCPVTLFIDDRHVAPFFLRISVTGIISHARVHSTRLRTSVCCCCTTVAVAAHRIIVLLPYRFSSKPLSFIIVLLHDGCCCCSPHHCIASIPPLFQPALFHSDRVRRTLHCYHHPRTGLPSCGLAFVTTALCFSHPMLSSPFRCLAILPIIFRILPTTYPTSARPDVRSSLPANRHVPPLAISPHSPSTFTVHLIRPPSPSTFTVLTSSPRSARPPPPTALPCRRHSNDPSIPST